MTFNIHSHACETIYLIVLIVVSVTVNAVNTINAIKAKFLIKKNWVGDPCAPKAYAWDGLICNYALSSAPRITTL